MVHGYRNSTNRPARFLVTGTHHDRYYCDLVDWMYREPIWPPTDHEALITFGRRHDTLFSVDLPTNSEAIHLYGHRNDTIDNIVLSASLP